MQNSQKKMDRAISSYGIREKNEMENQYPWSCCCCHFVDRKKQPSNIIGSLYFECTIQIYECQMTMHFDVCRYIAEA